jgi:hypothetical protein
VTFSAAEMGGKREDAQQDGGGNKRRKYNQVMHTCVLKLP